MKKIISFKKQLHCFLIVVFTVTAVSVQIPTNVNAQEAVALNLISISPPYVPVLIRGLILNPDNPFNFSFIVDNGDTHLKDIDLKIETEKLIKYFLASLTLPEDDMWVNLSPDEKNKIIPEVFARTDMGRDLLALDYLLKQLTASLIYPESESGRKLWEKIYKQALQKYGINEIPVDILSRVWIVPETTSIYENNDRVYIIDSHLKVMLEEDYLVANNKDQITKSINGDNKIKELLKEIIIPEIEKEINEGKNFAKLRQIFNSLILATWYKNNLRNSVIAKQYANQNKVVGLGMPGQENKNEIYAKYLNLFKEGVYDYIKEEYDPMTQEVVPKRYFSGGIIAKVETKSVQLPVGKMQSGEISVESVNLIDNSMMSRLREVIKESDATIAVAPPLTNLESVKIYFRNANFVIYEVRFYGDDTPYLIKMRTKKNKDYVQDREALVYKELMHNEAYKDYRNFFMEFVGLGEIKQEDEKALNEKFSISLPEGQKYLVFKKPRGISVRERINQLKEIATSFENEELLALDILDDLEMISKIVGFLYDARFFHRNITIDDLILDIETMEIRVINLEEVAMENHENPRLNLGGHPLYINEKNSSLDAKAILEIVLFYSAQLLDQNKAPGKRLSRIEYDADRFGIVQEDEFGLEDMSLSIGEVNINIKKIKKDVEAWYRSEYLRTLGKQIENEEKSANSIEAIAAYLDPVKHEEPRIRLGAVDGLGESGLHRAIPYVIKAMDDPNRFVQRSAAKWLGEFGRDKRLQKPLIRALGNSDEIVFKNAIESLIKIGDEDTVVELNKLRNSEPQTKLFYITDDHGNPVLYSEEPQHKGFDTGNFKVGGTVVIDNYRVGEMLRAMNEISKMVVERRKQRKIDFSKIRDRRPIEFFEYLDGIGRMIGQEDFADSFVLVGGGVRDLYVQQLLTEFLEKAMDDIEYVKLLAQSDIDIDRKSIYFINISNALGEFKEEAQKPGLDAIVKICDIVRSIISDILNKETSINFLEFIGVATKLLEMIFEAMKNDAYNVQELEIALDDFMSTVPSGLSNLPELGIDNILNDVNALKRLNLNDIDIGIKVTLTEEERLQFLTPTNQATERVYRESIQKLQILATALNVEVTRFFPPFTQDRVLWNGIEVQYTGPIIPSRISASQKVVYLKRYVFDTEKRAVYLSDTKPGLLTLGMDKYGNIYGRTESIADFESGYAHLVGDGVLLPPGSILRQLRISYQFNKRIIREDRELIKETIRKYINDEIKLDISIVNTLERLTAKVIQYAQNPWEADRDMRELGIYDFIKAKLGITVDSDVLDRWLATRNPAEPIDDTTTLSLADETSLISMDNPLLGRRAIEERREALLKILDSQTTPVNRITLFGILKNNPQFPNATLRQIANDTRQDERLLWHKNLLVKGLTGIERARNINIAQQEQIRKVTQDPAIIGNSREVGGIDFNPKNIIFNKDYSTGSFQFNFDFNEYDSKEIDSLVPLIINVIPISNLPLFLSGQEEKQEDFELTSL